NDARWAHANRLRIPGSLGPEDQTARDTRPGPSGATESRPRPQKRAPGGEGGRCYRPVPDVRRPRCDRCDVLRQLWREVHPDSNPRGRARRSRPRGDSGDGRGGARRREEPCEARRQAGIPASEIARGAASHPAGNAHRGDAFEKGPDEWPPPRAPRGAKGREDERAAGPHERSARPDQRSDEWTWPDTRSHERLGANERADERTRTYERAHERAGS